MLNPAISQHPPHEHLLASPELAHHKSNALTISRRSNFTDPGATTRIACAGEVAATASSTLDPNRIGSYTITYTTSDPSGNQATPVKRTVNVVEGTQTPDIQSFSFANPFPVICKLAGLGADMA